MHRGIGWLLAVGWLVGARSGFAQTTDPLITDRPDFTESPMSVARGVIQFEGGYTFAKVHGASSHTIGEVLLRLGIGGPLELRLGLNSYVIANEVPENQHGFEDNSVGLKMEVVSAAAWKPSIGILASASVPTGGEAFGSNSVQPELIVAMAWELISGWSAGSNVGFLVGDVQSGADNRWVGSAVMGRGLGRRTALFVEGYGFAPAHGRADLFVDAGLTVAMGEDLQLDFRVARQVAGLARESHFGVGIARRWTLIP